MLKGFICALLANWILLGCSFQKESVTSIPNTLPPSPRTSPTHNTKESKSSTSPLKQKSVPEPMISTPPSQSLKAKESTPSSKKISEAEAVLTMPKTKKSTQLPAAIEEESLNKTISEKSPEQHSSNEIMESPDKKPLPLTKSSNPSPGIENESPELESPAEEELPVLTPQSSDKENGQMIQDFTTKIKETEQLLTKVNQKTLTKEQHDTWVAVQNFLSKAKEAYSQKDFPMALNLVDKAQTLTREIVANTSK